MVFHFVSYPDSSLQIRFTEDLVAVLRRKRVVLTNYEPVLREHLFQAMSVRCDEYVDSSVETYCRWAKDLLPVERGD